MPKTIRDLLDLLDGYGLIVTDEEDLRVRLSEFALTLDTTITEKE